MPVAPHTNFSLGCLGTFYCVECRTSQSDYLGEGHQRGKQFSMDPFILKIILSIFGCAKSLLLLGLFSSCGKQGMLSIARASCCRVCRLRELLHLDSRAQAQ